AVSIKWSDEDQSFVATIPQMMGLSALGATRDEALSELSIAAEAYFEALKAAEKPEPLPEKLTPYSGQLRLRMPKNLHAALSQEAEDNNVSLNTYLVSLLSERHIENKLLKRWDDLFSLTESEKAEKTFNFGKDQRPVFNIKEKNSTYGVDKRKK
ncbi:MAG: type II toxin-antitoxin system HicB family antitoxin, partial [Acidobacteria bacterium]|nr:type II toxin-antitoxin system HicB family antitoxin [Acidobacteriota bacterium]